MPTASSTASSPSACAYDLRTCDYIAGRLKEGRTKAEIIRCLKRYIAREIYQALNNPNPST